MIDAVLVDAEGIEREVEAAPRAKLVVGSDSHVAALLRCGSEVVAQFRGFTAPSPAAAEALAGLALVISIITRGGVMTERDVQGLQPGDYVIVGGAAARVLANSQVHRKLWLERAGSTFQVSYANVTTRAAGPEA